MKNSRCNLVGFDADHVGYFHTFFSILNPTVILMRFAEKEKIFADMS